MAAFVRELPEAGEDEALQEGVDCPGEDAERWDRHARDLCREAYEGKCESEVSQHVGYGEQRVGLEAVCEDRGVGGYHRVFWGCEGF